MHLWPGSRCNQVIKGYFWSESSNQGVHKSSDQAPLWVNFGQHENLLSLYGWRSRIEVLGWMKSNDKGNIFGDQTSWSRLQAHQLAVSKWLPLVGLGPSYHCALILLSLFPGLLLLKVNLSCRRCSTLVAPLKNISDCVTVCYEFDVTMSSLMDVSL